MFAYVKGSWAGLGTCASDIVVHIVAKPAHLDCERFQRQAPKTPPGNTGYRHLWLTKFNCETSNDADPKTTGCAFGNGCRPHERGGPDRHWRNHKPFWLQHSDGPALTDVYRY